MNKWRLPSGPTAVLQSLHLRQPRLDALARLPDAEWRAALEYANRSQITLALRQRTIAFMPNWVREVTARNFTDNLERLNAVRALYRQIAQRIDGDFVALKGITHCPLFGLQPENRPQYDVDIYVPRDTIFTARGALLAAGFDSMEGMERFPTDHLPALIRKSGWQYRGNVFDPEMPLAIELHFQFWNGSVERLQAPGVEEFWARRVVRPDLGLTVLAPQDALAYACLHLLKHVLRGSARPFHIYEIACFLEAHADDPVFWRDWRSLHSPALRRLQAIAFRLAVEWFGCLPGPAEAEIAELSPSTQAWFDRFALSPAAVPFDSNKDELWLHLSLLQSSRDRIAVARRRLLPVRLPAAVDAVHVPASGMNWRRRARKHLRWIRYSAGRVAHHAISLPSVLHSGTTWARDCLRKRAIRGVIVDMQCSNASAKQAGSLWPQP